MERSWLSQALGADFIPLVLRKTIRLLDVGEGEINPAKSFCRDAGLDRLPVRYAVAKLLFKRW